MRRFKEKKDKMKFPHEMTFKELIIYTVSTILIGVFFFFIRNDMAGKMVAFMVCPMLILYLIYAYRKEKKADTDAVHKGNQILSGEYFESPEWRMKYTAYINEHPFERPVIPDMKKDLLKRFRRREDLMWMFLMLFLMFCGGCALIGGRYIFGIIGIVLFGLLFYMVFSDYYGMPVRKWLKGDIDYNQLNSSYVNSRIVTYKKNGFAYGTTHIHAFTDKKVYAIDYRLVEGISRKIVRMKQYEDGIYSSEEYQHFAVTHVRLPRSGQIQDVEIELNEYQVQMVIDNLMTFKLGERLREDLTLTEDKDNSNV